MKREGKNANEKIMRKLPRDFYARDTKVVAQELLGKFLVHHINETEYIGKIVEVEAYLGPHDLASHSSKGLTSRTRAMFGPPGHAYIYLIYGIYHCMNIVTEREEYPAAVLLRALEPIQHITKRTQGPGLLCQAMQIDKSLYGHDLTGDRIYVAEEENPPPCKIVKKSRIGVDYAGPWAKKLLRFYIKDNQFISKR